MSRAAPPVTPGLPGIPNVATPDPALASDPTEPVVNCEQVLTSSYAEIGGIPLAAFGAAAYFVAFSLAVLTAFGDRRMWPVFGVQVTLMAIFSAWLIYVQAAVIGAFCQFCLVSAATSLVLFLLFITSLLIGRDTRNYIPSESDSV